MFEHSLFVTIHFDKLLQFILYQTISYYIFCCEPSACELTRATRQFQLFVFVDMEVIAHGISSSGHNVC